MVTSRQALLAFAEQNPELAQLEILLKRFNLFEAVGAVRHELRHSDFLAFLLDPSRNHGLGAAFLLRFLREALDLDGTDLSCAYVLREWHHIDILIVDEASRLAVIIENKIDTGEHSDQLSRYRETFQSHFPGYQMHGLYLTPDGDKSSSPEYYRAISYSLVCEVIEQTAQDSQATLDAEIVMALEHYGQMLRRHIVSDSDVAELCRSIYKQHKQALDIIFEHRPDQQAEIREYVKSLVEQSDTLDLGAVAKSWVVFVPSEWHGPRVVTPNPPHLYFEFYNPPNELTIFCSLSTGDTVKRTHIFEMARKRQFTGCSLRLNRGVCRLAIISILRSEDYEKPQDEIEALISEKWATFQRDELPRMAQAIREEKWLWELP